MKQYFTFIFIIILFSSCEKNKGPAHEKLRSYHYSKIGEAQIAFYGNYLTNEVGIYMTQEDSQVVNNNFSVQFSIKKGNGYVDNDIANFINGFAMTKWRIDNTNIQLLQLDIFDDNNDLLQTNYLTSFGLDNNSWDTVYRSFNSSIRDIVFDANNNETYLITSDSVYKQTGIYYEWQALQSFNFDYYYLKDILINPNGTIFISDYRNNIYKSNDNGNSWTYCKKPISDLSYDQLSVYISNEGYLWASSEDREYSLRYSVDEGESWIDCSDGLYKYTSLVDIIRLQNNDILMLTEKNSLYRSTDNGLNWIQQNAPYFSKRMILNENNDIILLSEKDGFSIYKSTDNGNNFEIVFNDSYEVNLDYHKEIIQKRENKYYILIPDLKMLQTVDFVTFEEFNNHTRIYDFFIDDSGIFITNGYNSDYNILLYYNLSNLK